MSGSSAAPLFLGYGEWNSRLLRYYFGAKADGSDWNVPVTHLRVTADDLQASIDRRDVPPNEVLKSFLSSFAREHRDKTFSSVARDIGDWSPRRFDELPPFFVHLAVSCLVASDFESEDSYRKRLDEACSNGRSNSTDALPELWEQLRDWLDHARAEDLLYRALILPARRLTGWTRIGYSLDLVFPSRADREQLVAVVTENGLTGEEPSVSRVLAVLEGRTNRFSHQFRQLLADFQATVARGEPRWNHAFWLAVRHACLNTSVPGPEATLLMNGDRSGFRPFLMVRSREDADRLGFESRPFGVAGDDWPVAIHRRGDFEAPVRALLGGELTVDRLSGRVRQGLLGFRAFQEDLLVCGPTEALGGCTHALLRSDRVDDFLAAARVPAGGEPIWQHASRFDGWIEVGGFDFPLSIGRGRQEGDTLRPPRLEIDRSTGIPFGDGWLGERGLLPAVIAPGATSCHAYRFGNTVGQAAVALSERSDLGLWCFPDEPLEGPHRVEAVFADGAVSHVKISFYGAPARTDFMLPTHAQLERSFVESGMADVAALEPSLRTFRGEDRDFESVLSVDADRIFLGGAVGEWSDSRQTGFDWMVDAGAPPRVRFIGDPANPTLPSGTITSSKSAARAWRKYFTGPVEGPVEIVRAYRAVARRTDLTKSAAPSPPMPKYIEDAGPTATQHPGVAAFAAALAARGLQRAGIPESELLSIVGLAFGFGDSWSLKFALARAWVECGVLEVASDFRWSARRYFVRSPRLVLYRLDGELYATLVGLALPRVRLRIESLARKFGLTSGARHSVSEWAPELSVYRVPSADAAAAMSEAAEIAAMECLPRLDQLCRSTGALLPPLKDQEPAEHLRVQTWDWANGHFQEGRGAGEAVRLVRFSSPREPERFEVEIDGRSGFSSYCRNWAFLGAHLARRESPFEQDGLRLRTRKGTGAFLPLPLARMVSIVSGSPGPVRHGGALRHEYLFPSFRLMRDVLDLLAQDTQHTTEERPRE